MSRYDTRNDLKSNAKQVSIGVLNARLADSIDLALLTKQAHWNIKGPNFIALHEMIDGFRTELDDHVDTMAERVVQLGGTALGTAQAVAQATTLTGGVARASGEPAARVRTPVRPAMVESRGMVVRFLWGGCLRESYIRALI